MTADTATAGLRRHRPALAQLPERPADGAGKPGASTSRQGLKLARVAEKDADNMFLAFRPTRFHLHRQAVALLAGA
jgi:hypothetical protein